MKKLCLLILLSLLHTTVAIGGLDENDITRVQIVQQQLGEGHNSFKNRVGEKIQLLKNVYHFIGAEVNDNDLVNCGKVDGPNSVHLCQYKLYYKK